MAGRQVERLRFLEAALAALDVSVLVVDSEARLVFANDASQELAGRVSWPDLQVGKRVVEPAWRYPDGRAVPADATPLARALQGQETLDFLVLAPQQGRRSAVIESDARPIRNHEGRVIGATLALRDVTRRAEVEREARELADTLRQANERLVLSALAAQQATEREQAARSEAEEAVRARDEFLAAAAHELRTPVANLRGFAELTLRRIAREPARDLEQVRRAMGVIEREADRLTRLVERLLDVSRIQEGELRLQRQETDVTSLVQEVTAAAQAQATRHRLVVQAPAGITASVDPQRLEQVLFNLLDNAQKHSPADAPIEVQLSTPDPQTVRIAVRDHGSGIPPEERQHLFERFYQVHRGAPFAGLGLGLYVSRHIVEQHGGRIWAEFPQDGGSRFIVTIPRGDQKP